MVAAGRWFTNKRDAQTPRLSSVSSEAACMTNTLPPDISPADRLRLAGQEDHQRIYGEDFAGLLQQVGFHVTSVDESSFPASFVKRHCLRPPVLSTHPLATNRRKVFFARKTRRSN